MKHIDLRGPQNEPLAGPYFGQYGVITNKGDKAQCHICGVFFKCLGLHTYQRHEISHADYCMAFGLSLSTALASDAFIERQRRLHGVRLAALGKLNAGHKPAPKFQGDSAQFKDRCRYASKSKRRSRVLVTCKVCGAEFLSLPKQNRVVCSTACSNALVTARQIGVARPQAMRDKVSAYAKTRDLSHLRTPEARKKAADALRGRQMPEAQKALLRGPRVPPVKLCCRTCGAEFSVRPCERDVYKTCTICRRRKANR